MKAAERICLALDFPTRQEILSSARRFAGRVAWMKVGLEAFTAEGPSIVREVAELGPRVFLDLKLHDIPATVERAVAAAARTGAAMINVHAFGGPRDARSGPPRRRGFRHGQVGRCHSPDFARRALSLGSPHRRRSAGHRPQACPSGQRLRSRRCRLLRAGPAGRAGSLRSRFPDGRSRGSVPREVPRPIRSASRRPGRLWTPERICWSWAGR